MNKKGISILEYALIIFVIAAALAAMYPYLRNAISGKWRQTGDTFGFGMQYSDSGYQDPHP